MQILNLSATLNVASLEPSINTYRLGEGAGTYEYPELNNKPKINGVTLVGDISSANLGIKTSDLTNDSGFISEADIPTATSDLTNDSGFVNSTQVQSVVSDAIPSDISYFNNDVGYITDADIGNIPTKTSQLINDSGYITSSEAPVVSVNNMTGAVVLDGTNIKYEQSVSLNAKIDAVEGSIPTQTSQLTNDSGFITNANVPTRTSQLVNDSGFINVRNIPVQSVNGKTGTVELTAADIDYDSNNTVAKKIDAVEGSIPTATSQLRNDSGYITNTTIAQTGTIEDVAMASFSDGADNVPVSELIVNIKARQDLHGYDKPWVGGAGKNLLNYDVWKSTEIVKGTAVWENNGVTLTATADDCCTAYGSPYFKAFISVSEGDEIWISWEEANNTPGYVMLFTSRNGDLLPRAVADNATAKSLHYIVTAEDEGYIAWRFGVTNSGDTISYKNIQIEKGSSVTAWSPYENIGEISGWSDCEITRSGKNLFSEAYNGNTYTVDFGQTVYGGYLNVTTGALTITRGYKTVTSNDKTSLFYILNNCVRIGVVTSDMKLPTWGNTSEEIDIISNIATPNSDALEFPANAVEGQCCMYNEGGNPLAVFTLPSSCSTANLALTKLVNNGCEYCYPLANPITVQLTPTEVKTLLGNNNISADTGNINKLVYFKTGCEAIAKLIEAMIQ